MLSCVPLVLLLCCSCASPYSLWGFWRDCGGFTEPVPEFDSTALSIIQMESHFRSPADPPFRAWNLWRDPVEFASL